MVVTAGYSCNSWSSADSGDRVVGVGCSGGGGVGGIGGGVGFGGDCCRVLLVM